MSDLRARLDSLTAERRRRPHRRGSGRTRQAELVICERKRQERADVLDAPRQVTALEADGGPSDVTIEVWLEHVGWSEGGTTP